MQGEYSHIQYTLPSELFEDDLRSAIVSFFEAIFGWKELSGTPADTMVFTGFRSGQYLVFKGREDYELPETEDHFGLAVSSRNEHEEILEPWGSGPSARSATDTVLRTCWGPRCTT